jgi:NAD+ synthase
VNEKLLDEIKNQDYAAITKKIEDFLKNQVAINNTNGVILGLSGGIDSSVITYLCARVLKDKTLALKCQTQKYLQKRKLKRH